MRKYLIALDLDGTLLTDWQSISETTKEYLKELDELGHTIVIATGRPFRSSEKFYDELGLTTPIINYNGGLVTSKHDPNFVPYSITMPREQVIDIFNSNKDVIENAFGEVGDDIFLYEDSEKIRPLLHYFNDATLTVGNFEEILQEDTNGFLIVAHQDKAEIVEEYVRKNYENKILARNWGHHYNFVIELYTPETTKGAALENVSNYLGFESKDIIAFGDAHNDIDMLKYAGVGVAMSNAQDVLKEHADFITKYPNTEDGIVKFLREFFEQTKTQE